MRILFTRFPLESRYGGAEVQTISLMKGLLGHGHAVAFLGSCPILLEQTVKCQIPNADLQIGPPPVTKWHAWSFTWRRERMRQTLEGALREFCSLDVVCMLSLSEKLLLTPFALKQGLRVLWIEHDRIGRWLRQNPWLPALRTLSKSVTTITVSELSRRMYMEMGWEPSSIIAMPNGVDEERLHTPCHGDPDEPSRGLHTGTLSRLSQDKGIDLLVAAAEGMPEMDVTIIGTGPEEGLLRNWITSINLREALSQPRLRIVGNVDALGDFYRSLDVFVLPSRQHDPFGLVAAEAMLCGTATIVTDACGIAGYVKDDQDALIVRADDCRALVEALKRMGDPGLRKRIAEQGQKTAREKFSLETMIDAYLHLFSL